jgi:hypothetical protein
MSEDEYEQYEIREMREMFDGIYVAMFPLFSDEVLQYYISESQPSDDGQFQEYTTQSDMLHGIMGDDIRMEHNGDRYGILNDIMLSISLKDNVTAQQLTEEYMCRDFCARELFRVL